MEPGNPSPTSAPPTPGPSPEPGTPVVVAVKTPFWKTVPRWQLVASAIVLLAIIGTGVSLGLAYRQQTAKSTGCEGNSCNTEEVATATPTPQPTPTPLPRLLDGTLVAPGSENIRPLAVMIENHVDARPQSGLQRANWVYEAIAEGGITRFMALFADPASENVEVGPVRSIRTYYVDYAREYNAFLAHVGGNSDALESVRKDGGVTDLDQFGIGAPTYQRDQSKPVATEHTMYSSTKKLWDYITSKKYDQVAGFEPLLFTDDAEAAARGTAQTVGIDFSSSASFAVSWTYDSSSNSYARTMAGTAHKDAKNGEQIRAKNIVLQTVQRQSVVSSGGKVVWKYTLTGSGKAVVIQNGKAEVGTWKRTGNGRTRYYGADGTELKLVRGTTWVEVVHPDTPVSY